MESDRYARQLALFGEAGQRALRSTTVAIVGLGGNGTHVVQQLSLFGVGGLGLIEPEELTDDNRGRYIGVRHDDPVPGSRKVDLAERLALSIDPTIHIEKVADSFVSEAGFALLKKATVVFGCVDREGPRLILNEFCSAYALPYFDLATEIDPGPPLRFGGRVCLVTGGSGCLACFDVLDRHEAASDLASKGERENRRAIYGVPEDMLGGSGPSVVSVNGVIASLAATEFMVTVTGLRPPARLLKYHGHLGKVTSSKDLPHADCYHCKTIYGTCDKAGVERYLSSRTHQPNDRFGERDFERSRDS